MALARPGDLLMSAEGHMGPTAVIKGRDIGEATLREAAALTARYGQGREEESITVSCWPVTDKDVPQRPVRATSHADDRRRCTADGIYGDWRLAEAQRE